EKALHVAADITFKAPFYNNAAGQDIWRGNSFHVDFQNDPYALDRQAYDPDHNWQLIVSLGENPEWWLFGSIGAAPNEPVSANFRREDKPTKDGHLIRLDVPWSILLQGDGKSISPPRDNDLGAIDFALNASDPTLARAESSTKFQLTWSGSNDTYTN